MHQKAWRENVLKRAGSHEIARWKIQRKKGECPGCHVQDRQQEMECHTKQNCQSLSLLLKAAAAAAYAAEVKSREAMEESDAKSAHEQAGSAHEAADSAREAAYEAKEDAAEVRCLPGTHHSLKIRCESLPWRRKTGK